MAIAYAIAFLQRVSPQSVSLSFMHDFSTDAAGVAMLASSYFWGYTLMQIPAGLLVDRYGVKRVVLFSMAASSLGSAAFALAPNLLDVFAARLVIACGDALVFTALLKLVAQSFTDERFGVMSGISQVSGYVGGVMATTPLAAAVSGLRLARLLPLHRLRRPGQPRLRQARAEAGSGIAQQQDAEKRRAGRPAIAVACRELGLRHDFCVPLRRGDDAVGRVGHSDGGAFLQYLAGCRGHSLARLHDRQRNRLDLSWPCGRSRRGGPR